MEAISRIENNHHHNWENNYNTIRAEYLKECGTSFVDRITMTKQYQTQLIDQKMKILRFEKLKESYINDEVLESLSPGYATLLCNRKIAENVSEEFKESFKQLIDAEDKIIRSKLVKENPILSRIGEWLSYRVNAHTKKIENNIKWEHLALISEKLNDIKLYQEANISTEELKFQKNDEKLYIESVKKIKEPRSVINFEIRIWDSAKWIIKKEEHGEHPYHFIDHKTHTLTSANLFWRWHLVLKRTETYMLNGMYWLLFDNLWNGAHGLRAMNVFKSNYFYRKTVNQITGKIQIDTRMSNRTYRGNLEAIYSRLHNACQNFEYVRDEGILGKNCSRPFHRIYHYGMWLLATLIVFIGQPIGTIVNLILSIILVLTSLIWSSGSSIGILFFSAFIVEIDSSPKRYGWFTVFFYLIYDIILLGIGTIIINILKTVFVNIPLFFLSGFYAFYYYGVRTVYDAILRSVLKYHMVIPGVDR